MAAKKPLTNKTVALPGGAREGASPPSQTTGMRAVGMRRLVRGLKATQYVAVVHSIII